TCSSSTTTSRGSPPAPSSSRFPRHQPRRSSRHRRSPRSHCSSLPRRAPAKLRVDGALRLRYPSRRERRRCREMASTMVLTEDEALELLAFLVTAARTQVDEAAEYGPLRLLTAAGRPGRAVRPRSAGSPPRAASPTS